MDWLLASANGTTETSNCQKRASTKKWEDRSLSRKSNQENVHDWSTNKLFFITTLSLNYWSKDSKLIKDIPLLSRFDFLIIGLSPQYKKIGGEKKILFKHHYSFLHEHFLITLVNYEAIWKWTSFIYLMSIPTLKLNIIRNSCPIYILTALLS